MRFLLIWILLVMYNVIWQKLQDIPSWETAFERSYFQAWPILACMVVNCFWKE